MHIYWVGQGQTKALLLELTWASSVCRYITKAVKRNGRA